MDIQTQIDEINSKHISKKPKKKWYTILFQIFLVLAIMLGIAYSIFSIIYKEIDVIGVSMQPTLNPQLDVDATNEEAETSKYKDKVCVNRFNSGENGDIIVFEHDGKNVIKRLIASEGDTIRIGYSSEYGRYMIFVNGEEINDDYISNRDSDPMANLMSLYNKLLKNTQQSTPEYVIQDASGEIALLVPEGKFFALGDNRVDKYSYDSLDYGFVDKSAIIGKVEIIIPHDTSIIQYFWKIIKSLFGVKD